MPAACRSPPGGRGSWHATLGPSELEFGLLIGPPGVLSPSGTVSITGLVADNDRVQRELLFTPTNLTDGIEESGDPMEFQELTHAMSMVSQMVPQMMPGLEKVADKATNKILAQKKEKPRQK